jgi:hypothetical protein
VEEFSTPTKQGAESPVEPEEEQKEAPEDVSATAYILKSEEQAAPEPVKDGFKNPLV